MKRRFVLTTLALLLPVAAGGLALPRVAGAAAAAGGQTPLTAAQAQALSANVTDKVIVVFKNQLPATPDSPRNAADRAAAVDQVQAGVVESSPEPVPARSSASRSSMHCRPPSPRERRPA